MTYSASKLIFIKRNFNLLQMIFIICSMTQTIQANDVQDEYGRTELMNYVIAKEKEIGAKRAQLSKLSNKFFTRNQDSKILEKKVWITDEDVAQYRELENECDIFIEDIIENIKVMVLNGANLKSRDLHGKSITDYCDTKEIYDALRNLGAPLSLNEQTCGMIILGILGIVTIHIGVKVITACYEACFLQEK